MLRGTESVINIMFYGRAGADAVPASAAVLEDGAGVVGPVVVGAGADVVDGRLAEELVLDGRAGAVVVGVGGLAVVGFPAGAVAVADGVLEVGVGVGVGDVGVGVGVGAGTRYQNRFWLDVPNGEVAVRVTGPDAWAGIVSSSLRSPSTVNGTDSVPRRSVRTSARLVPVIVTVVPPSLGPRNGLSVLKCGAPT